MGEPYSAGAPTPAIGDDRNDGESHRHSEAGRGSTESLEADPSVTSIEGMWSDYDDDVAAPVATLSASVRNLVRDHPLRVVVSLALLGFVVGRLT
jgi:hypothetical protein